MSKLQMVRKVLNAIGIQSIGVYNIKGKTHIMLHCQNENYREYAKELLSDYLSDDVVIQ